MRKVGFADAGAVADAGAKWRGKSWFGWVRLRKMEGSGKRWESAGRQAKNNQGGVRSAGKARPHGRQGRSRLR